MLRECHEIEIQPVHIGAEQEPAGRHGAADPHYDRNGEERQVEKKQNAECSEALGYEDATEEDTRDDQREVEDWYQRGDQAFSARRIG